MPLRAHSSRRDDCCTRKQVRIDQLACAGDGGAEAEPERSLRLILTKHEAEGDMEDYKDDVLDCIEYTEYMNISENGNHWYLPVVYTLYGEKDDALYIGSSQGLRNRLMWHSKKPYWKNVKRIGVRMYPDREQMRIAELALMFANHPKYNRDGMYDDDKECLIFGIPGIKLTDETEEAIFERDELYEGYSSSFLMHFRPGQRGSAPDQREDQLKITNNSRETSAE